MGMSASQVRLLSLTARQHDIEYRAQELEARKLQMANESNAVYNKYLEAMDATKIQTRVSNVWDDDSFVDATLNILENNGIPSYNGDTASKQLFLEEISTGKMFITPAYAAAHGLKSTGDLPSLDDYLTSCGDTKTDYPQYKTISVDNPDSIKAFTAISNSCDPSSCNYSETWDYSGAVANSSGGGINYAALAGYASYNNTNSSVSGTELSGSISSLTSGQTYTVSNASELVNLENLVNSGVSTSGVTIKLAGNIDMSGVTGWTGIGSSSADAFQGVFDGNGFTISDLSGTQGLFGYTGSSTTDTTAVKNVALVNENITGNSAYVGGLIGYSENTSVSNAFTTGTVSNSDTTSESTSYTSNSEYSSTTGTGGLIGSNYVSQGKTVSVSDVYSTANVSGHNAVGGLFGSTSMHFTNTVFDLKNAYAIGNVSGDTMVGGLIGDAYYDEDNTQDVTDITNCYAGGNVSGNTMVGGFVGNFVYWGDNGDYCTITDCESGGNIVSSDSSTTGGFAGDIRIKNPSQTDGIYDPHFFVDFVNCGYSSASGASKAYGKIIDTSNTDMTTLVQSSGSSAGLVSYITYPGTPSATGLEDNIYAAMIKAGDYDPNIMTTAEVSAVKTKINTFVNSFNNNATDNAKLYNLNTNICKALSDSTLDSSDTNFLSKLTSDVNNGTTTNTVSYQTGSVSSSDNVQRSTSNDGWTPASSVTKGTMNIPSIDTIATELALVFKKTGSVSTDVTSDIKTYLQNNYSDLTDDATGTINKAYLAEINKVISDNASSASADNDLQNLYTAYSNSVKYTVPVKQDIVDHPNMYQISMSSTDQSSTVSGSITYNQMSKQVFDYDKFDWDYTNAKIAADVEKYKQLQDPGYIIVSDDAAASNSWVTNMINAGVAQFATFDSSTGARKETSLADETSLQEVANDTYLKKAEATYEAQMTKINNKETNIDNQLEELDTERTAIKTEEDSLKQVIKDNVNLNFKLFS